MANVVVTMKIMPESPEVDLGTIENNAKALIKDFAGAGDTKTEITPIAFGLKSVSIIFVMDETLGSPDSVADKIAASPGVQSAEVSDVRRAIG